MPRHMSADLGAVGGVGRRLISESAARHHQDAVGELEQLVEVLAHQQHGGTAVARRHDLAADHGHGGEIQAEAGIGGDEDIDLAAELARQHDALHIAARELADGRFGRGRLDAVAFDLPERRLAHGAALQPPTAGGKGRMIEVAQQQIVGDAHRRNASIAQRLLRQQRQLRPARLCARRMIRHAMDADFAAIRRALAGQNLDELPLTPHGKINENALTAIDVAVGPTTPPETPTEMALAEAFTDVLGAAHIDVTASFLQMGLDSIVALSVVQAARRRGIALRARLMVECETIRELAAAIDSDAAQHTPVDEAGEPIPVLPNVHWLYGYGDVRRLAQTEVIRLPNTITREGLDALLCAVVDGHEMLRCRLDRAAMTLVAQPKSDILSEVWVGGDLVDDVAKQTLDALESLDPQTGRLLSAVWLREPSGPGVLVITAHVLAMDPASWRIVLSELDAGLHALAAGRKPTPAREHTSYRQWSRLLAERAAALDTEDFWADELHGADPPLGARRLRPQIDRVGDVAISISTCGTNLTARLLAMPQPMGELLVTAAARTVTAWRRRRGQETPAPLLALETHGRADIDIDETADTSDTVGLLSAIYPLRIHSDGRTDLARIPGSFIDYALLRYLRPDTRLHEHPEPQLLLNYLGSVHVGVGDLELDRELMSAVGRVPEPEQAVRHELTVVAGILGAGDARILAAQWRALPDILDDADIAALQELWTDALREMAT